MSIKGRVSCQLSKPDFWHNISVGYKQKPDNFASLFSSFLCPKFLMHFCFACSVHFLRFCTIKYIAGSFKKKNYIVFNRSMKKTNYTVDSYKIKIVLTSYTSSSCWTAWTSSSSKASLVIITGNLEMPRNQRL